MEGGEQQGRAQGEEAPTTVRVVVRQRQGRTAAWRARAGPWQQRGAVAEASGGVCARGIDGRPRSAAQAAHGRPVWAPRRRGGASPCSCRGVSVNGMGAARTACALKWRGRQRRGTARQRGSEGAAAAQHGSERTRAQVPARARRAEREGQRGREREERGREWREKEIVNALT